MKLSTAILLTAYAGIMETSGSEISSKSRMGTKLLKSARRLDQNQGDDDNIDYSWMGDFSLKFIGCHHVAQWNAEVDDENEVRIASQRFVRFQLCPTDSCHARKRFGCTGAHGDYVVDMDTFVQVHLQNEQEIKQENCELQMQSCGCNEERKLEENGGDDCLSNCYYDAGMGYCMNDEENENNFLQQYAVCNEYDNGQGDNNAVQYYIGPYCAEQGGAVNLGMFIDNTCTTFADDSGGLDTYKGLTAGGILPYSSESWISNECQSCQKSNYYQDDEGALREMCEELYPTAGKCEYKLENVIENSNNDACNWIHGIGMLPIKSNGIIHAEYHGTLKAAIAIAFFALTFILLSFYVCYLRSKIVQDEIARIMNRAQNRRKAKKSRYQDLNEPYKKKKKKSFFGWTSRIFKKKKSKNRESFI